MGLADDRARTRATRLRVKPSPRVGAELGCLAAAVAIAAAATRAHLAPGPGPALGAHGHRRLSDVPRLQHRPLHAGLRAGVVLPAAGGRALRSCSGGWRQRSASRASRPTRRRRARAARKPGPTAARAAAIGRLVLVGAVLGLELVLSRSQTSAWIRGWLVPRRSCTRRWLPVSRSRWRAGGRPFWLLLAAVNAAASVLTVFGLYGVSAATQVRVAAAAPSTTTPSSHCGSRSLAPPRWAAGLRCPGAGAASRPLPPLERRASSSPSARRPSSPSSRRLGGGSGRCEISTRASRSPPRNSRRPEPSRGATSYHPRPPIGHPPAAIGLELGRFPLGQPYAGWFLILIPARLDRALRALRLPLPAQLAVSRRHADRRRDRAPSSPLELRFLPAARLSCC